MGKSSFSIPNAKKVEFSATSIHLETFAVCFVNKDPFVAYFSSIQSRMKVNQQISLTPTLQPATNTDVLVPVQAAKVSSFVKRVAMKKTI